MLQDISSKAVEGGVGSLKLNDLHSLVQNRKDCAHQVLVIWCVLELLPFVSRLRDVLLAFIVFVQTRLDLLNFLVARFFAFSYCVDEEITFENGTEGFHSDCVFVNVSLFRQNITTS